jgi:hypothetical protein
MLRLHFSMTPDAAIDPRGTMVLIVVIMLRRSHDLVGYPCLAQSGTPHFIDNRLQPVAYHEALISGGLPRMKLWARYDG